MWDSDSDSDCCEDHFEYVQMKSKHLAPQDRMTTYNPPDEVIERWINIPFDMRMLALLRMKLCAYWLPMLLKRNQSSSIAQWALEIGLINSNHDISMKQLKKIEIVEAVFRALENGTLKKDQTKHVFWISRRFCLRSPEAFEDAIRWLERAGEPLARQHIQDFGLVSTGYSVLLGLFTEFARFIYKMGTNFERTMNALLVQPSGHSKDKCEEMKKKGNEKFQSQEYEEAVKFYSKAIKLNPENHMVYGNRALCFIRCKNYHKAMCDGKRAILIDPLWPKGHYRFCEALSLLGERKLAIEANKLGRHLCGSDQEGYKDLEQQYQKFVTEMGEVERPLTQNKQPDGSKKTNVAESKPQTFTMGAVIKIPQQTKAPEVKTSKKPDVKTNKQPGKNEKTTQAESAAKGSKAAKSELPSKSAQGESGTAAAKKAKNKPSQAQNEKPEVVNVKAAVCKELKSVVHDAHTALTDLRSRNAEQAFSQALVTVEANNPKELGLSTLDVLLLLYGRASALTEIGQPEELGEAQRLLQKIKSYEERTFQCLVFYAIGRVYLRENRFAVALEQFSDSLQMVKNQITPGKLTWPLTKEIVKETQPDYFKDILENNLELCRFPPAPDAVCRLVKCLGHSKTEIYITDPNFKGFIEISCCQSCTIEYHIACWKTLKTSPVFEKSEKDFLLESCFTPDCVGKICNIKIYGPTGLLKCKFEADVPRPKTPKKPKVNQKCTSLKKLKSKEQHRQKRRQFKQSFQNNQVINEESPQKKEDSTSQSQQKAWLLYRDRVLLQISQNMELLREEKGLHVSTLTGTLKPWLELDLSKGNQIAQRILNLQQEEQPDLTLGHTVELLLERKNRVWARVFVEVLSSCEDLNPKLNNWACHLNDAGLNAAKSFIERYAGHLEQLDLAFLLNFSPLQEVIIEKFGTRPEPFSSIGLTVTEYLKQAPPHDMRLFIWTLEEHRDDYVSCHSMLDEYFDMMEGHCSVLKKSDENENNSPLKSRRRKKKHREPMGVFVFPTRSLTPRDEFDQDYFEDDSLSFLHPADPFSVPSHLREQVADFEEQYNSTRHGSHYKNILDNNPDPTKESLYDYFAQILEEHGPLEAEDRLLVGELDNFPPVAQEKIQEAGGFKSFLLESLRFIQMGRCIGLTKHAVSLQEVGHRASLDDLDDLNNLDELDELMDPQTRNPYFDSNTGHEAAFTGYPDGISSSQTQVYPILPNPYGLFVFGHQPLPLVPSVGGVTVGYDCLSQWSNGDSQQQAPYFVPNGNEEPELYCSDGEGGLTETDSSSGGVTSVSSEESLLKKHVAVQTSQESMRSVAVNTELHERFESCQGDLNKKQKRNKMLELQIKKISNSRDKVELRHKEDLAVLEEDIQKVTVNIQVTNTELALFQQKLEEEVKKDQNEKKANQEALKSLKVEIENLVEEQRGLTRNIRGSKGSFDAQLKDFLELNNQSAAEKMSLEDEIKRCKASLTLASRRSKNAQLSVVESSQDQSLYSLQRELADNKAFLTKLDEAVHRYPNQDLEVIRNTRRANVQDIEKKISTLETQFKEQMDQVKNGRKVHELLPVNVSKQNGPPAAPTPGAAGLPSAQASSSSPPLGQQAEASAAPPKAQNKPPTRTMGPPHSNTVFNKAIEHLASMFPDYTRSELMKFFQELRSSNGGTLSSMALQDMVGGVSQLILDHQEQLHSAPISSHTGRRTPAQSVTPPLTYSVPVWQTTGPPRSAQSSALNVEDPCIICHDDMSPDDICVLECRHSFHNECIRSWLKEQSTCPTCRDHALLPEEFPALTGRRRP
ncbi:E3 ubiquitin-protein ligase TTC3 [Labrus bergylta]|uniref:E3 ubiquitin-protein ligase TTC3 n=1 Tax=Labrus bergylta TaxID=56723 RepID=UPI003313B027